MILYHTILADPPWSEIGGGRICRGAQAHYPLMKTAEIIDCMKDALGILRPTQTAKIAENAHLYLWVTNNFLPDGLKVMAALGFEYKTIIVWRKDRFGLGQYFRGNSEPCLFGVRGCLPYRTRPDGKRAQGVTCFEAPRREHSQKPDEIYEMAELVSHPPYLELFARGRRQGWDAWGNEVGKIQEAQTRLPL